MQPLSLLIFILIVLIGVVLIFIGIKETQRVRKIIIIVFGVFLTVIQFFSSTLSFHVVPYIAYIAYYGVLGIGVTLLVIGMLERNTNKKVLLLCFGLFLTILQAIPFIQGFKAGLLRSYNQQLSQDHSKNQGS